MINTIKKKLDEKYPKLSFSVKNKGSELLVQLMQVQVSIPNYLKLNTLDIIAEIESQLYAQGFVPPAPDYKDDYFVVASRFDSRDYSIEATTDVPESVSFKQLFPEAYDQGRTNTCVAQTLIAIKRFQENIQFGQKKSTKKYALYYIYNQRMMRTVDKGMSIRNALNILNRQGIVLEEDYPVKNPFSDVPVQDLAIKAKPAQIKSYAAIRSLEGLKTALYTIGPCIAALPIYNSSTEFWKKHSGDELLGLHAVTVVGYSDNKKEIIIRNSWGENWGDKGYASLKYDDFDSFTELWALIDR